MRDEVLSSVGSQDMDKSWYQAPDLADIDLLREDPDLNIDAVLQPGIYTPFSPLNFNDS